MEKTGDKGDELREMEIYMIHGMKMEKWRYMKVMRRYMLFLFAQCPECPEAQSALKREETTPRHTRRQPACTTTAAAGKYASAIIIMDNELAARRTCITKKVANARYYHAFTVKAASLNRNATSRAVMRVSGAVTAPASQSAQAGSAQALKATYWGRR